MLLESYDPTHNVQVEQQENEEFSFPFSQEPDLRHDEMFAFQNDNRNTYNLRNKRDGIPPGLQPTPPDPRASNNPPLVRPAQGGPQYQNQVNIPTILKNLSWSTEKYNAVEDLKKKKGQYVHVRHVIELSTTKRSTHEDIG